MTDSVLIPSRMSERTRSCLCGSRRKWRIRCCHSGVSIHAGSESAACMNGLCDARRQAHAE
eukprot:6436050-Heterocapsa_arctica.AAC.1